LYSSSHIFLEVSGCDSLLFLLYERADCLGLGTLRSIWSFHTWPKASLLSSSFNSMLLWSTFHGSLVGRYLRDRLLVFWGRRNWTILFFIDLQLKNKESVYPSWKKEVWFFSINNIFVRVEVTSYKVGEKIKQ